MEHVNTTVFNLKHLQFDASLSQFKKPFPQSRGDGFFLTKRNISPAEPGRSSEWPEDERNVLKIKTNVIVLK